MNALYVAQFKDRDAILPPMRSDDGYQLHYQDSVTGELAGGFSLVGPCPEKDGAVLVWIDACEEVHALLKKDARFKHLQDIAEEPAPVLEKPVEIKPISGLAPPPVVEKPRPGESYPILYPVTDAKKTLEELRVSEKILTGAGGKPVAAQAPGKEEPIAELR